MPMLALIIVNLKILESKILNTKFKSNLFFEIQLTLRNNHGIRWGSKYNFNLQGDSRQHSSISNHQIRIVSIKIGQSKIRWVVSAETKVKTLSIPSINSLTSHSAKTNWFHHPNMLMDLTNTIMKLNKCKSNLIQG